MRYWLAVVGAGCLALPSCTGSNDEAGSDDTPTATHTTEMTTAEPDIARRRPHLACLPLDEDGWSRSEQIVGAVGLPVSMAANDDAVVIIGPTSAAGDVAAFRSLEGEEWERADGFPDMADWGPGRYLAAGPERFVAVATRNGPVPNTPVVAVSADGATWEQVDPASLPRDRVSRLSGVFAGAGGFVVVGTDQPHTRLFMWHSSDGRTWSETDMPPLRTGSASVAATESGWAAVTAAGNGQVEVWNSTDGKRWVETATTNTPPSHAVRAYIGTAPLVAHDGALLLVVSGAADDDAWSRVPTVWVSTDDGATWTERSVRDQGDANGFQVDAAASTGFGVVLAGQQDRVSEQAESFLHHSHDGVSWEWCWTTPLAFAAVAMFGDRVVAYDAEFGDVYTWNP